MKKARSSLIARIALALFLVGSLVAITAVPAAADVTNITVTPTPATVNSAAQYIVNFTVGAAGALTEDVGNITITFPTGTVMPTSIPAAAVSVGAGLDLDAAKAAAIPASSNGTNLTPPAAPYVVGLAVTITTPVTVANNRVVAVLFSQAAGIVNPARASITLKATVATSSEPTAVSSTAYEIKAVITRSPTSGARSTAVAITGAGFTPTRGVDIVFTDSGATATTTQNAATTDANGGFTATITVPATALGGTATIRATDGAGVASGTVSFTVSPSLTLSVSSGLPGTNVTITGSAWPGTQAITATVGGANATMSTSPANQAVQTTGGGAIPTLATTGYNYDVRLTIPVATTPGVKTIVVTAGTTTASATFEVTARPITLSVTSGNVGTQVSLSGSSMTASGNIAANSITFGAVNATHAQINITAGGDWSIVNVAVPPTTLTGAQTVLVTDNGGRTALATFTVASRVITLSPTSGRAGTELVVTGTGFLRNGTVNVLWNGAGFTGAPTPMADSSGNFAASFTNPANAAGGTATNLVTATDSVTNAITASASFSVPGASISVSPTSGAVGSPLTISGTNFAKYDTLTALTIGAANVLPTGGVVTDANGSFSVTVTVPGTVATGVALVNASTATIANETANFTVTAAATTVATQLTGLGTNLVRVWGFAAATQTWQMYDPAAPTVSDLTSLVRGQGYWVKVNTAQTLVVGGFAYSLSAGWNLIGWQG